MFGIPLHVPEPLHSVATFSMPFAHDSTAEHVVALDQSSQAPPWQSPSVPQVDDAVVGHAGCPAGEGCSSVTLPHIPSLPDPFFAVVHASHAPVHALLQQTALVQNPLAQVLLHVPQFAGSVEVSTSHPSLGSMLQSA